MSIWKGNFVVFEISITKEL